MCTISSHGEAVVVSYGANYLLELGWEISQRKG
jgi:hypothetical protein